MPQLSTMNYHPKATVHHVTIDDFPMSGIHAPNTVVITVSGPGSASVNPKDIERELIDHSPHLSQDNFLNVYRLELPFKYYFTLNHMSVVNALHGTQLHLTEEVSFSVSDVNRECRKVFLKWVPGAFGERHVRQIVASFTKKIAYVSPPNNKYKGDQWMIVCEVEEEACPHYISVNGRQNNGKPHEIFVSLQGRRTPCKECGDDTHFPSKCPRKNTRRYRAHDDFDDERYREEEIEDEREEDNLRKRREEERKQREEKRREEERKQREERREEENIQQEQTARQKKKADDPQHARVSADFTSMKKAIHPFPIMRISNKNRGSPVLQRKLRPEYMTSTPEGKRQKIKDNNNDIQLENRFDPLVINDNNGDGESITETEPDFYFNNRTAELIDEMHTDTPNDTDNDNDNDYDTQALL